MAANIDTMVYIGQVPWHNTGIDLSDNPPKNAKELVAAASLGWKVNSEPMVTKIHDRVPNYQVIYREDNNTILGVVNKARPFMVQNEDMFNTIDGMISKSVDIETAASLGVGEKVFGCFKIREPYKLIDDDMDQYFVVMNDHLKVDGKVTVLNTPVRVVCQNTLSAALSNNLYKVRVPITADASMNSKLSSSLLNVVNDSVDFIKKRAEDMVGKKIDKVYVERLLDMLFPYQLVQGEIYSSKANENVSMMRSTFLTQCMDADNLQNYKGTQWQVYNAITDWNDHYFRNADKAYDFNYRMTKIYNLNSEGDIPRKFMQIADSIAA